MDRGIAALATGLADSVSGYLGTEIQNRQDVAKHAQISDIDAQRDEKKQQAEFERQKGLKGYESSLEDVLSPDMAEKVLPGAGAKLVNDYNTQNPQRPLKLKDGIDYLKNAAEALNPDTSKEDNHQDTLEKQAMDRLTQVRGDQSLMRAEHQRDSAGMAYDTIAKVKSENRDLTELEQTDLLAQLFQARTGKAPTDNDMKSINEKTAKRGFNHMITYLTGDPTLIGASTKDTLNNIQQFVDSTGNKADQQWDAYMGPRLEKPTKLEQSRWDHIVKNQRGISYSDQKKTSDATYKSTMNKEDKKAALRAKLGL